MPSFPPSPPFRHRLAVPIAGPILASLLTLACLSPFNSVPGSSMPVVLSAERPNLERVGRLVYRGGLELRSYDPDFGGLSTLHVIDNNQLGGGRRFMAVSDAGRVVTGGLAHDADGRLTGIDDLAVNPLPDVDGLPVMDARQDPEGLARRPDGGWVVSFERDHRLMGYPPDFGRSGRPPVPLPAPPGLTSAPANGGAEAIATLADGRLLVLQEVGDDRAGHPAWIGGGDTWGFLRYRPARHFRPTDVTTLPSGDVLVLERRASWFGGFAARIVRVAAAAWQPGAVVEGEELARLEAPLTVDNMEGISALPGDNGETLIWLVSDNNFNVLQRTLLLQFALEP